MFQQGGLRGSSFQINFSCGFMILQDKGKEGKCNRGHKVVQRRKKMSQLGFKAFQESIRESKVN